MTKKKKNPFVLRNHESIFKKRIKTSVRLELIHYFFRDRLPLPVLKELDCIIDEVKELEEQQ